MWHYSESDESKDEAFDDLKDLEIVEIKSTDVPKELVEEFESNGWKGSVKSFFKGRASAGYGDSWLSGFRECYLTHIIMAINLFTFFLQLVFRTGDGVDRLVEAGSLSWPTVVYKGQVYRLFTCQVLHANVAHLLGNMVVLMFAGNMLEKRFSRFRVMLIYIIGGLGSSLVSMTIGHFYPTILTYRFYNIKLYEYEVYDIPSIGASGAIAAMLGAIILYKLFWSEPLDGYHESSWKPIIELLVFFEIIEIVSGFFQSTPGVDNAGHIGGLIAGVLTTFAFMLIEYRRQSKWD